MQGDYLPPSWWGVWEGSGVQSAVGLASPSEQRYNRSCAFRQEALCALRKATRRLRSLGLPGVRGMVGGLEAAP
jgi:hypothetical protein